MEQEAAYAHGVEMFSVKRRRELELQEAEVFRTVRRLAREDVAVVHAMAPSHATVVAASAALARAATLPDVLALEPLVQAAWTVCGLSHSHARDVLIGERYVAWSTLGSYAAVASAASAVPQPASGPRRITDLTRARGAVEAEDYWSQA
jgi:hypothetical protein